MADVKLIYAAEPTASGSLFVAPIGTDGPDPADPFADLDADFIDLGHIGEDGFNETTDRRIDRKRNFGGKVVKVLWTEFGKTLEVVLLESLNGDVLKAVYGTKNVDITAPTTTSGGIVEIRKNAKRLPHQAWVVDTLDTSLGTADGEFVAKYRSYIPDGQIVDTKDVRIVHSDTIEYAIVIEAFEDEDGEFMYTWADDGRPTI
jgi:hypothetical protein